MGKDFVKKIGPKAYFIFRIVIGFLFFSHGAAKLFGWFGATAISSINIFWFAGLFEVLIGLAVFFGVLTRIAAIGGAVQMIVAYFMVHVSNGVWPIQDGGGELAILFVAVFIVIAAYGAGIGSLEKVLFGRELI